MAIEIMEVCQRCAGTGNEPGGTPIGSTPCIACNGTGKTALATSDDLTDALSDLSDKLDDILELLQQ